MIEPTQSHEDYAQLFRYWSLQVLGLTELERPLVWHVSTVSDRAGRSGYVWIQLPIANNNLRASRTKAYVSRRLPRFSMSSSG